MKTSSKHKLSLTLTALALGIATSFPQSVSAATLYSVLDLGTVFEGDIVNATGLNDLGQVVGSSKLVNGDVRAFLFDENTMFDLNTLIADSGNFIFTEAVGINEQGQIAVNGFFGSDTQTSRAFLLTPVPEPTTMLGALAFGAGAGFLRKRSKQKLKA